VGGWRVVRFGPTLEPGGPVEVDAPHAPEITIAFALVKGDRNEWIVQKLTELGVDRIVPFVADRSVLQWDEAKAARNRERLTTVARRGGRAGRGARPPP